MASKKLPAGITKLASGRYAVRPYDREATIARVFIAKGRRGEQFDGPINQAVQAYLAAERQTRLNGPETAPAPPSADAAPRTKD